MGEYVARAKLLEEQARLTGNTAPAVEGWGEAATAATWAGDLDAMEDALLPQLELIP